jgi:hypothetical protein
MTKNEFRDRIKSLVKQVYSGTTKSTEVDLDTVSAVSLDTTRFPVLAKFPSLLIQHFANSRPKYTPFKI